MRKLFCGDIPQNSRAGCSPLEEKPLCGRCLRDSEFSDRPLLGYYWVVFLSRRMEGATLFPICPLFSFFHDLFERTD